MKTKEEQTNGGKFLKIECPRCRRRYIIYGKASSKVKCEKCNYLLLETKGGKARIRAPIKEVIINN